MKNAEALPEKARLAIEKFKMRPNKTLVGFSGGADSTALLHFLVGLWGKDAVAALHVNHGIRGENADRDEENCRAFCLARGIEFHAEKVDVPAESGGAAIEETARRLRYAALVKTAKEIGADAVALAHTADDNAETFIFNVSRGCGISGLGIPPVRDLNGLKLIRPLIYCAREDVMEYVKANSLPYVTDETNADEKYSRNYIRKNIIPPLSKLNGGALKNVSALSDRARDDEDFIDGFAEAYMRRDGAYSSRSLRALHPAVLSRVLMKMAAKVGSTPSYTHIRALEKLISSGKTGDEVKLPDGCSAVVADGKLRFFGRGEGLPDAEEYSFDASRGAKSDALGFEVRFDAPEKADGARVFSAKLKKEDVALLTVRSRRAGDAYRYGNMTRTVKKLTTKVPFDARSRRPVFASGDEILWYPGCPVADGKAGDTEIYYIEKIF
ncbi:MAG: tRNA lysidine(34) synthetase TilS [Clostridia bacterium]|nr:tRNA lysidine(34) synthetase TilS [Clostridia bacterium]